MLFKVNNMVLQKEISERRITRLQHVDINQQASRLYSHIV